MLGDSTPISLRSLSRLRKRFDSDPQYQEKYSAFLSEYESLGHMTPVPTSEIDVTPAYYLPHHGVIREQSQTTKLRVVFNGSSKTNTSISLNEILHSGPKLQSDIANVILWFRLHRYVFSIDIEKMFRQIGVHEEDQNLQRIFWIGPGKQIPSYKLTTVTYGLTCAPFLALRVLNQLLDDEGRHFPLAAPVLTKGRYVDDIFGGAESIDIARETINQVIALCRRGGFELQKWSSNSKDLLSGISVLQRDGSSVVTLESSAVKILGLTWQPSDDVFRFSITLPSNRAITKRTVLSEIAQLYDPLGFISPLLIRGKMFIQELWLAKVDWDEPLSTELRERWKEFRSQLSSLSNLSIPRWLNFSTSLQSFELHGFSDASNRAMAAVVYLRAVTETGEIVVNLVSSKTKVAPIKKLTIPRLELSAAVLLSRLVVNLQEALDCAHCPVYMWTDSAVTLNWIASHPSRWKDFVQNRVSVIQEVVPHSIWRFVSGKENPADCGSRGISTDQLEHHPLWWTGPSWLKESTASWTSSKLSSSEEVVLEERKHQVLASTVAADSTCWDLLDRYSSITKLFRITALCRRVVARFRSKKNPGLTALITTSELKSSRNFWVKHIQSGYYDKEIRLLSRGEMLPKNHSLTKLTPFLDGDGILRVGGRLQFANLEPDAKHPVILPRKSKLTTLVIAEAHTRTLHGGTQLTLSYTRQLYWIVGGRTPVRSYILRCVKCARYRATRAQQLMGQLPTLRVTPTRPFLNSGVDYAGPVSIKTWRGRAAKIYKGYIAVFVCLSTSAVHLELVTDCTTDAFIAAYKQFTSRRGICSTLSSDCGTNFVGADKQLRQLFHSSSKELKELAVLLSNLGTRWRFIPPAAPHFGGKWEAAVKSTKYHLKRMIGDSLLTYEEFSTLLTQVEAVLNSRPLCPLSEDSNDLTVLTPGHFLIGAPLNIIPEPSLNDQPISRLSRWQLIRQKIEQFWKLWSKECLQRYQSISKWHHPSNQIKEGSMVLLVDERYPPAKWPLARVTKLHPGQDGLTRVVTVRSSSGTYTRPVTKLCVLPPEATE